MKKRNLFTAAAESEQQSKMKKLNLNYKIGYNQGPT